MFKLINGREKSCTNHLIRDRFHIEQNWWTSFDGRTALWERIHVIARMHLDAIPFDCERRLRAHYLWWDAFCAIASIYTLGYLFVQWLIHSDSWKIDVILLVASCSWSKMHEMLVKSHLVRQLSNISIINAFESLKLSVPFVELRIFHHIDAIFWRLCQIWNYNRIRKGGNFYYFLHNPWPSEHTLCAQNQFKKYCKMIQQYD